MIVAASTVEGTLKMNEAEMNVTPAEEVTTKLDDNVGGGNTWTTINGINQATVSVVE